MPGRRFDAAVTSRFTTFRRITLSALLTAAVAAILFVVVYPAADIAVFFVRTAPAHTHDLRTAADSAWQRRDYREAAAFYGRLNDGHNHTFVLLREACAWGRAGAKEETLIASQKLLWSDKVDWTNEEAVTRVSGCGREAWRGTVFVTYPSKPAVFVVQPGHPRAKEMLNLLRSARSILGGSPGIQREVTVCMNQLSSFHALAALQRAHFRLEAATDRACVARVKRLAESGDH